MVEPFAPTVFENKGSRAASEVAKKIAEFDVSFPSNSFSNLYQPISKSLSNIQDDEFIAEDSVLEKPPQIKDLDEETSPNKKPTNTKPSSHADDVDEFDF